MLLAIETNGAAAAAAGTRKAVLLTGGVIGFLSLASANPFLSVLSILALLAIFLLLWRPHEPPVLLFAVTFQWLQAATKVFQANLRNQEAAAVFGHEAIDAAIILSLAGLLALAIGARFAIRQDGGLKTAEFKRILEKISVRKAALLYFLASAGSFVLLPVAFTIPSLTQPLLVVANFKWFFFFIFACAAMLQRRDMKLLIFAILLEVGIGFSGFFSDFKQVFFVLILAVLTVQPRITGRGLAGLCALIVVAVALALVWTAVKPRYRAYLSGDTGLQIITRDLPERLETLAGMVMDLDADALLAAAPALADRLAYVDFFAHAILFVPSSVAHTNGELWGAALSHVAMPRIFFPEKPPLPSDSEIAARFTGVVAVSEGTSISIGYMTETYIDFGEIVMFGPLLGLGWLLGFLYASILRRPRSALSVFPAAVVVLAGTFDLGMALPKLLGALLMSYIVVRLWLRFGAGGVESFLSGRAK